MSRHGDLSVGTLSCIGIVDCYKTCADTDATCLNDCYYSGTVTAQRLIDAATFNCPATKLCGGKSDAGATQCTPADTSTSYSQECLDCINNADSNAFKAACANEIRDCQNDKASS